MTNDRTFAPVQAQRPAARAASQSRDAAPKPETPDAPAFVLTVAAPPAASPASVPVTVAAAPGGSARAGVPARTGAVAASVRMASPIA
jgi:hypothetical protein